MSIIVPQNIQYPGNMVISPARRTLDPVEPRSFVSLELDWSAAIAAGVTAFDVNVSQKTTGPFSQIATLDIDNTRNTADISIMFLDSADTLFVPAYGSGTLPVFTNTMEFFVSSKNAISSDVTFIRVLNYAEAPVELQQSTFTTAVFQGSVNLNANSSTPILGLGINAIVSSIVLTCNGVTSGSTGGCSITITDGSHAIAGCGVTTFTANPITTAQLLTINGAQIRTVNGLNLVIANTTLITAGACTLSLAYRQLPTA